MKTYYTFTESAMSLIIETLSESPDSRIQAIACDLRKVVDACPSTLELVGDEDEDENRDIVDDLDFDDEDEDDDDEFDDEFDEDFDEDEDEDEDNNA